jgi:propionyl-CoA carboxylase beta chain
VLRKLSLKKKFSRPQIRNEKWKEKEIEYAEMFANPYQAAARGYVDEVIIASQTREKLIKAFDMLKNKAVKLPKKKHGNIPL